MIIKFDLKTRGLVYLGSTASRQIPAISLRSGTPRIIFPPDKFRCAYRGLNVPGASAPGTITAPLFFLSYEFAYAVSITPCGGREMRNAHLHFQRI